MLTLDKLLNENLILPHYRKLSFKEREILSFMINGYTKKEIAKKTNRSIATINIQTSNILKKLGFSSIQRVMSHIICCMYYHK